MMVEVLLKPHATNGKHGVSITMFSTGYRRWHTAINGARQSVINEIQSGKVMHLLLKRIDSIVMLAIMI